MAATLIKKYGNRRLYDTGESRYLTLDELAAKIRGGTDVRVVDAQTSEDLTQATLVQVVLETGNAGKFLPVPLLQMMIRLDDDVLADFFSRYGVSTLEMYIAAKRGMEHAASLNPLARIPAAATDALTRMWAQTPFGASYPPARPPAYGGSPYAYSQGSPYVAPPPGAPYAAPPPGADHPPGSPYAAPAPGAPYAAPAPGAPYAAPAPGSPYAAPPPGAEYPPAPQPSASYVAAPPGAEYLPAPASPPVADHPPGVPSPVAGAPVPQRASVPHGSPTAGAPAPHGSSASASPAASAADAAAAAASAADTRSDVADMRRELEELKQLIRDGAAAKPAPRRKRKA